MGNFKSQHVESTWYFLGGMPQINGSKTRENSVSISSSQIAVVFHCAISLALSMMLFYCAISLALVQHGITCSTEVTEQSTCQSVATSPFKFHIFLIATLMPARAWCKIDCDYRYALKILICLHRLIPRKLLQASCLHLKPVLGIISTYKKERNKQK